MCGKHHAQDVTHQFTQPTIHGSDDLVPKETKDWPSPRSLQHEGRPINDNPIYTLNGARLFRSERIAGADAVGVKGDAQRGGAALAARLHDIFECAAY